jgi:hypothetical protein
LAIPAGEGHAFPAQEPADDSKDLLEATDAIVGRVAERLVLKVVPARSETEGEPKNTPAA